MHEGVDENDKLYVWGVDASQTSECDDVMILLRSVLDDMRPNVLVRMLPGPYHLIIITA